MLVQTLGVNDRAHRLVDVIGAYIIQEFQCARTAHLEFIERGLVEQPRVFTGHQVFVTDGA